VQGRVVNVCALALEQQQQQVFPVAVLGEQLDNSQHGLAVSALVEHREELQGQLALALTPPASARLEREDKEVLDARRAARFSSLGEHVVHKVPEARVVKPSHQLVEESEQRVAQALGRELRVPVLAAETAFVRVIGLPVDRNARELRERRRSVGDLSS
jgi:hypothetical protein